MGRAVQKLHERKHDHAHDASHFGLISGRPGRYRRLRLSRLIYMITLGASWGGSSAIPATAPIRRPEPNAWRRHPGDGTCIAMSTGASCSSGSRPCSSRVCSSVGGAAGITESACGARFRQRGCRKCDMNARSARTAAGSVKIIRTSHGKVRMRASAAAPERPAPMQPERR